MLFYSIKQYLIILSTSFFQFWKFDCFNRCGLTKSIVNVSFENIWKIYGLEAGETELINYEIRALYHSW